jgi:hypothetical protein
MANIVVICDLRGPSPTSEELDQHFEALGVAQNRVLGTAWYVAYRGTAGELLDYVRPVLGKDDMLLVIEGKEAAWTRLLVNMESMASVWLAHR